MNLLTKWIRSYLPELPVDDRQLAEDLTLRGIAVEGEFAAECGGARFEMDLTTNRVDAMNHYGVAREVAAIYDLPLAPLDAPIDDFVDAPAFPLRIEANAYDLCGKFTARVIRGVTVGPSTGLVAEYFSALGQKMISAPVDATNFGWLAIGQPTHVFDLDKLEGGIVVRLAHAGEKLKLLDGSEHTLVAEDLVIADEVKALGLAGVMGGWDSRVTDETKNILVEAAWFDPGTVRASSRRHGLHTDASHRYERGADFDAAYDASNLVTRMIVEQCGGKVFGRFVAVQSHEAALKTTGRAPVRLRVSEVVRHLGPTLDDLVDADGNRESALTSTLVARYLSALGCELEAHGEGEYAVTLPSWRLDLEREIDLIEEVARVYGYNRFANTLPSFAGSVIDVPHAAQEHALRMTLRSLGYSEAISSSFTSAREAEVFGDPAQGAVAMGNPLSEEAGLLRPSLVPGMAAMLAGNLHRDVREARLFELGTHFTGSTVQVNEAMSLAVGLVGGDSSNALYGAKDALFFEAKGTLVALLAKFVGEVAFDTVDLPAWLAVGRGARILLDGKAVAVFGELSATEMQRRKLRQACVVAEVRADILFATALRVPVAGELSRYQAVERDFSFVFPDAVRWNAVSDAGYALGIKELRSIAPLEIFRDAKSKTVAAGSYSVLLRAVFQAQERTLTDEELAGWSEQIIAALTLLGGTQRV